ncbi:hypothetical protein B296_00001652 [Ensete ventricosum]|uniref:Uncharacterized protein n=1 Tax=Ensete ventricosum TaxID=4639 RepID=A0A427AQ99_ENSVE|nr:hypothetical protein B296_00001652 [Ensete ventricosum]
MPRPFENCRKNTQSRLPKSTSRPRTPSETISWLVPIFLYRTKLQEEHESHCRMTLQDYEPTGETPVRSEPDVPSKGMIECLRAMPMETLLEDFRENHPYESSKESKPTLIPRSPLAQRN